MSTNKRSWLNDLPFPRHWIYYGVAKIAVLAFVIWLVLHSYNLI